MKTQALIALCAAIPLAHGLTAEPKFEAQTIDAKVRIGYGLVIGDVDGDGKDDILLADQSQFVWYRNGDWKRFLMAENVNPRVGTRFRDNVCIAARDIDGDGKVEVAVGAQWNPGETTDDAKSGSVHYLVRPDDPTKPWKPVRLHHEPTVHRMHWIKTGEKEFKLIVLPLHGRGNKGGAGAGVKVFAYDVPDDRSNADGWKTTLVDESMHMTHNFDIVDLGDKEGALIGGKEGIIGARPRDGGWEVDHFVSNPPSPGVGEVRGARVGDAGLIAAIEPMHGNHVVVYRVTEPGEEVKRTVLDDTLSQGHALALADVLGSGSHQVIAGWRSPDKNKKVGIRLYTQHGDAWKAHVIDDNKMACEDLKVADLNADGKPDIIAAGRATKNLVIYWNKSE